MITNVLIAIKNIVTNPVTNLVTHYSSHNRINNVGEALEIYIKDIFADSVIVTDNQAKL
ncbi:MAG TPA: NgoPII family restriction endonuclease, partial [bacterium]|nr:NgoPII family restriction endonuclease [bacterium]